MKRPINWVAASIFFLAGSLLYAVPAMARSILYAGRMAGPSWQFPDPIVERLVPDSLTNLAFLAYLLCVFVLGWPQLEQFVNAWHAATPKALPHEGSDPPTT